MANSVNLVSTLRVRLILLISILIGALLLLSYYLDQSINQRLYDAKVLNLAGKQSALTQAMEKILVSGYTPSNRESLQLITDELLANQRFLNAQHSNSIDIVLNRAYSEGSPNINALVRENASDAMAIFDETLTTTEVNNLLERLEYTYVRLDDAVITLQKASSSEMKDILQFVHAEIAIMIGITFLLVLIIYLPMERKIGNFLKDIIRHKDNYQNVLESMPDAVVRIDEFNNVTHFSDSAEALWGYKREEVLGKNVSMLVPKSIRGEHDDYIRRHRETGVNHIIGSSREVNIYTQNNELKHCILYIAKSLEPNGKIVYTGFIRDITEYKKRTFQLKAAREIATIKTRLASIGELAAGVAHEINNPLTIVTGRIHLLELAQMSGKLSDNELANGLKDIKDGAQRIENIVRSMKKTTQMTGNKIDLHPEDITTLCEQTVHMLKELHKNKGIPINLKYHEHYIALAEATAMQQVVINLVNNAVDALQDTTDPVINVSVYRRDDDVVVTVDDNGEGIEQDRIGLIFKPLHTSKSNSNGTGLGLSIVKRLVENMQGSVKVQSIIGRGTEFSVHLPLCTPEQAAMADQPKSVVNSI
jgi:PAS domain S-box-containing protein